MSDIPRLSELVPSPRQPAAALIRFCCCLARARSTKAAHILTVAEEVYPRDPQLLGFLKAAVAAGSLSNLSALSPYRTLASELITIARPSSIVLRLSDARSVPLRVRIPRTTAAIVVGWVGEGLAKPVSTMSFDEVTLDPKKLVGVVVFTDELARFSAPAAESVIRQDLISSINAGVDAAFISSAAATSAKPAGILNSVTPIASTGSTPAAISADVSDVIAAMVTAGGQAQELVAIAHPSTIAQISLTFGGAGASFGIPIITSAAATAGTLVILDQAEILIGDDEDVEVALSSEASVMLDSAPVAGTTAYTSLWQHNLVGIRSERTVNWTNVHGAAAAAGVITGVA